MKKRIFQCIILIVILSIPTTTIAGKNIKPYFFETFSKHDGSSEDKKWELGIDYDYLGYLTGGIWKVENGKVRMEYYGERAPFAHPKKVHVKNFIFEAEVIPMSLNHEGPEIRFIAYLEGNIILEGVFDYYEAGHVLRLMIAPGSFGTPHSTYQTTAFTMVEGNTYSMKIIVEGQNVRCFIDETIVLEATDPNVAIKEYKIIVICGYHINEWGYWDNIKIWRIK